MAVVLPQSELVSSCNAEPPPLPGYKPRGEEGGAAPDDDLMPTCKNARNHHTFRSSTPTKLKLQIERSCADGIPEGDESERAPRWLASAVAAAGTLTSRLVRRRFCRSRALWFWNQ